VVDIIIPVYGAPDDLSRCLASVVAHTDLAKHRVVLVIDGPQDFPIASGGMTLLQNEQRVGFAASVNRGMAFSKNDVVLLNSDTIVTSRWLEKLIEAAYSSEKIGTVTPLSNDATLCSVPRSFESNIVLDVDAFAAHVERVSAREYPRLPTGVGFCMFIRRALIDEIGLFDAESFAAGYGEENDFCMRALARGWENIADDATFVYHAGHRSFGASRERLMRRARRALARTHPRYMEMIADFMRRDLMKSIRDRIAPPRGGELRIVHLVHGWPPFQHAGTELYAYWLAHRQRESHYVAVYARYADPSRAEGEAVELLDDGVRVRLITNNFTARNPIRRNAIRDRHMEWHFKRFLEEERPDVLHVHHLAGHAFSLIGVAKKLKIPVVLQIQDWWFQCARVNRYHRNGTRCSGPSLAKCAACVTLTKLPMMNRVMHVIRARAARAALRACDAYVVGSNAIRDDYALANAHVIPYGIALEANRNRSPVKKPIRFGYVGAIAPHKGVHTAIEAMRGIDPRDATLHLWGDRSAFPDYLPEVKTEGRFREEEKAEVFASMDVLLVPSIGLESFGLAAREAMASGVPVIATSGGALDEMSAEFFPPGDADALRAIIRRLINDPSIVDRWRERLPQPKRAGEHAKEIECVYRSVLSSM